jgi:hypothetical protein
MLVAAALSMFVHSESFAAAVRGASLHAEAQAQPEVTGVSLSWEGVAQTAGDRVWSVLVGRRRVTDCDVVGPTFAGSEGEGRG